MKYQFVIALTNNVNQNTASSKAVNDCTIILERRGYKNLNLFFVKDKKLALYNFIKLTAHLLKMMLTVKQHSVIVIQYPLLGINNQINLLIKLLKRVKKCRFVCITHDVESLRTNNPHLFKTDIHNLSQYDVVITHNQIMKNWLKAHGLKTKIIALEMFDYLNMSSEASINTVQYQPPVTVAFAGNLSKSSFIYKLHTIPSVNFNLYGPHLNQDGFNTSTTIWRGSFNSDEILSRLHGHYGLIWDGGSIEECSGEMGEYLQYNNPHKLSLYLAVGLPVIVPNNSAISHFVIKNNLGITVESLTELPKRLINVTNAEYNSFKDNAVLQRTKLLNGYYFNSAITKFETIL